MSWLLTDKEIEEQVNRFFPGCEIDWDSARAIAQAQYRKLVEGIERHPDVDHGKVFDSIMIDNDLWQEIRREVGLK